jgi:hypothetical protein
MFFYVKHIALLGGSFNLMKSKIFALMCSVLTTILVLTSCEGNDPFGPSVAYTQGNKKQTVTVTETDTVVLFQTVHDTIKIIVPCDHDTTCNLPHGESTKFECLQHNEKGEIVLKDNYDNLFTFVGSRVIVKTGDAVYFNEPSYDGFELVNGTSAIVDNKASFTVFKGNESQKLTVYLGGITSVLVNDSLVSMCGTARVDAVISKTGTEDVDGKKYDYAVITYKVIEEERDGNGNVIDEICIAEATQKIYAPIVVEEPKDKYTLKVDLEKTSTKDFATLVLKGFKNGNLDDHQSIDLPFNISADTDVTVHINNMFSLDSNGDVTVVSVNTIPETKSFNELTVTYDKCEYLFKHEVSAGGVLVTNTLTATCLNNFVVTYHDTVAKLDIPVSINFSEAKGDTICKLDNEVSQKFNLQYEGIYGNDLMIDNAYKAINEVLQVLCFNGERIVYANRSISFNETVGKALIFDCVLTEVEAGGYSYHYCAAGTNAWDVLPVSSEAEYNKLLENAAKPNSGLANYYTTGGWKPGVVESADVTDFVVHKNYENGVETLCPRDHVALRTLLNGVGVDKAVIATAKPVPGSGNIYLMKGKDVKIYVWVEK